MSYSQFWLKYLEAFSATEQTDYKKTMSAEDLEMDLALLCGNSDASNSGDTTSTAASPGKIKIEGGGKRKSGYLYLSCNICGKNDDMTMNQKTCRKCKRDADHCLAAAAKRDEE